MIEMFFRLNEVTLKPDHAVCIGTFEPGDNGGKVPPYSGQFALSRENALKLEPGKLYKVEIKEG